MTEQMAIEEAIKHARKVAEDKRADADFKYRHGRLNSDDYISCAEKHEQLAKWLEELKQYRAIGTVEELQALKEKSVAMKPDYEGDGYYHGQLVIDTWICPNCRKSYEVDYEDYKYCPNCGQHIDHSGLTEDD